MSNTSGSESEDEASGGVAPTKTVTFAVIDEDGTYIEAVPENWLSPHPHEQYPTVTLHFPPKKGSALKGKMKKGIPIDESWPTYTVTVLKDGMKSEFFVFQETVVRRS